MEYAVPGLDCSRLPQRVSSVLSEICEPIDLCLPNGRLNDAAVGYSRRPLHRTNLSGWGRTKRWEYWGVVTTTHAIGMTISNLDYLAVNQLYVLDRATGQEVVSDVIGFGPTGAKLQDDPAPLTAQIRGRKLTMAFVDHEGGTTLSAKTDRVEVSLDATASGDCLAVVVPWDDKRFQYTVKDLARPVTGSIRVDGKSFEVAPGQSYAALDRGRGRWPYSLTWNWATAAGLVGTDVVGLQLGGKWTDGTGSTENGIFVNGHLTYWPDSVTWDYNPDNWYDPWHITGEFVDAVMVSFHVRSATTNLGVLASSTQQAFGTWSGTAIDGSGQQFRLDGLEGWAEQARNRW